MLTWSSRLLTYFGALTLLFGCLMVRPLCVLPHAAPSLLGSQPGSSDEASRCFHILRRASSLLKYLSGTPLTNGCERKALPQSGRQQTSWLRWPNEVLETEGTSSNTWSLSTAPRFVFYLRLSVPLPLCVNRGTTLA